MSLKVIKPQNFIIANFSSTTIGSHKARA